jgi:hypothetical protein
VAHVSEQDNGPRYSIKGSNIGVSLGLFVAPLCGYVPCFSVDFF